MKINSVNPLYLILDKIDGYIEEKMEMNLRFIILAATDKNKGVLIK